MRKWPRPKELLQIIPEKLDSLLIAPVARAANFQRISSPRSAKILYLVCSVRHGLAVPDNSLVRRSLLFIHLPSSMWTMTPLAPTERAGKPLVCFIKFVWDIQFMLWFLGKCVRKVTCKTLERTALANAWIFLADLPTRFETRDREYLFRKESSTIFSLYIIRWSSLRNIYERNYQTRADQRSLKREISLDSWSPMWRENAGHRGH